MISALGGVGGLLLAIQMFDTFAYSCCMYLYRLKHDVPLTLCCASKTARKAVAHHDSKHTFSMDHRKIIITVTRPHCTTRGKVVLQMTRNIFSRITLSCPCWKRCDKKNAFYPRLCPKNGIFCAELLLDGRGQRDGLQRKNQFKNGT